MGAELGSSINAAFGGGYVYLSEGFLFLSLLWVFLIISL